jgi:RND family efflux transporter MFP subunit
MKSLRPLFAFALCLQASWMVAGCGKAPEPAPEPVRPVQVIKVEDPSHARMRTFAGTVRPALEADISFRVAGKIVELPIKPGVEVRKGELIARLDPSDHELQVKQSEAQVNQSEAMFKQAKADYERVRSLYESQSVSKSDLDQARAAFESAEAQQAVAIKALEMARLQLEYGTLFAPFDGRVSSRPVEVYQTVNAGQTVAMIAKGGGLEMVMGLPEVLINRIQMGNSADITFGAIPGKVFKAEVSEIGAETSGKSTYPVRLAIHGDTQDLRVGMTGEASIAFATDGDGALYVPAVSVVSRPDGTHYVWVVEPDAGIVEQRSVTVGPLTSSGLQILTGLQPGESVVTRGVHRLTAGIKVRIME